MKITPKAPNSSVVVANTKGSAKKNPKVSQWWKAANPRELASQIMASATYLKENQTYRHRQAAVYARLYGNQSLFNFAGSNLNKVESQTLLPQDRPTFNLIGSATDTLLSRISQSRPAPTFLTDNSDYKERNLAKQLNGFIQGEFYQTKAYDKATIALRDALVLGTGVLKIYETQDNKVGLERRLSTELMVDPNESMYGEPRQLYEVKLVDRDVLRESTSGKRDIIDVAENAYPDDSSESSKTVSDQVLVVEAWHLPSGPNAKDGRHVIACSSGVIFDEEYDKDKFPFVFLHYSPRLLGFWAQGLAEQLMGSQMEINSLLWTISKAIKLVGVPRIFQEVGSKVTKVSHNNDIGAIIEYRGVKPIYEVAPCNAPELYAQLQRTIDQGYQQCGVSMLSATSQKPQGLDSGQAIRTYDDISADRFNTLSRRYDTLFVDLAYQIIDKAKEIAERDGKYQTIYPNKDGTKQIDLPKMSLLKNPVVIQCFNSSSLPKDPAGRMQKVTEMIQSGMITIKEGRRLLDYPDLDQVEKLANSSEERILQIMDAIIEDGEYTPPDQFMDLQQATEICVQYINLYGGAKLEPEKMELLQDFFNQITVIKQAAMPPAQPPQPMPQANPEALPTSPLVPNANQAPAQAA